MKQYWTRRLAGEIKAASALTDPAWETADVAHVSVFPWYKSGLKQNTDARVLWTPRALHVLFVAQDVHSCAERRELNGPVYMDSCVEFFASPWPAETPDYFNVEVNCCGGLHVGFGPNRHERRLIPAERAAELTIRTTFNGPTKEESPEDTEWRAYMRLPRKTLSAFCGREVRFEGEWRANFYRCGGKTDEQYGVWNTTQNPKPDYHVPEQFGALVFEA